MIGERIQYLRCERNLTQVELAKILNVSKSTLASYEQNARKPAVETIIILAEYFNVTADYILGLTNKPTMLEARKKDGKCLITLPSAIEESKMAMNDFQLIKEFIIYKYNKK